MRSQKVSVAIVNDSEHRFLICWNAKWEAYAFPMTVYDPEAFVLPSTAVSALESDLGQKLPGVHAKELGYVGKFGVSGRTDEGAQYQYWVFQVPLDGPVELPTEVEHPPRWMTYDEILVAEDVTWSTQEVARAFVANQKVALAVLTRLTESETEYLLLWNDNYQGFFFPGSRIAHELGAEATARGVLRHDLGYRGEVAIENRGEVEDYHYSERYGRKREYRFDICSLALPSLDLNLPRNLLERNLTARGLEWRWYTADQLRNPPEAVSPTLDAVRDTVFRLIPPKKRDNPLRRSDGGIALISQQIQGEQRWLVQWNQKWKAFFFVGGHREENENFRDCAARETMEELGLEPDVEFRVAPTPMAHLEYVAYSSSAGEETAYTMELFDTELIGEQAKMMVEANRSNYWVSADEIQRMEAHDGRAISVTVPMLLHQSGVLSW